MIIPKRSLLVAIAFAMFFSIALPATAQKKRNEDAWSEWDEFRFTQYDFEVSDGLQEVQRLMQGREDLLQAYERTTQSRIATERAIEGLRRDRINTEKAGLALYEAELNFQFPDFADDYTDEPIDEPTNEEARNWISQFGNTHPSGEPEESIPPRIRIRSLSETKDGVSIEIENLGDPIDALISVADSKSTIISNPYHIELTAWDYPRWISFNLLSRDDKINLLIQSADGKNYKISLFLKAHTMAPRMAVFPYQHSARVGESAEFIIVIEGDPDDTRKYPISITNLPRGIAGEILKLIPAIMPDDQPQNLPIRALKFSKAFNRHELALELTISRDFPRNVIGKPILFTLRIGSVSETLSITPIGVGELTVDVPAMIKIRLGESEDIRVNLRNTGSENVNAISLRTAGRDYGVEILEIPPMSLAPNEQREVEVTLKIAEDDAPVGQRAVPLMISSSAGSQTAELHLEIQPKSMTIASLTEMRMQTLIGFGFIIAIYAGIKLRRQRQTRVDDYDVSPDNDAE